MKRLKLAFTAFLAAFLALFSGTYAWFAAKNTVTFPSSFGSAQAAYFAAGDGSKETPYVIGSSVHLYNLAWLQYLGYFNLREGFNNGRAQNYFRLSASIDCGGLALPPIGTEEYPFIGHFNGNGKVISNVKVSNDGADLVRRPTNANFWSTDNVLQTTANADVSIVGLFGVTGDYGSFVEEKYQKDESVSVKDSLTAPKEAPDAVNSGEFYFSDMQIKDFYVNGLQVNSRASKTLVGLVAGYVCSTVKNTGVYACNIFLKGNASGLTALKKNASTTTLGTVVSKYSIVGDYDESLVAWTEKPVAGGEGGSQGDGAAWGGSIDMRTLNQRLNYMITRTGEFGGYSTTAKDLGFRINAYRGASSDFYWNVNGTGYTIVYLNDETVLPVNVNKSAMGLGATASEKTVTKNNKTYHTNDYYDADKNVSEIVGDKNTGYIVGGGTTTNGYIVSRIQALVQGSANNQKGIYKSFGFSDGQGAMQYDKNSLVMLTIDTSGESKKEYIISDHVNQYTKSGKQYSFTTKEAINYNELSNNGALYKNVRDEFDNTMDGAYMAHGFHFLNKIDTSNYETENGFSAQIYDKDTGGLKTLDKYPFVKGGINFTVSDNGTIKTIVGAFYGANYNSLFDLYKVDRATKPSGTTSKTTINSLTRIKAIYKRNDTQEIVYNPENTDGLTKVFDFSALVGASEDKYNTSGSGALENGAAYYFEIPVTAGDYVIGADSTSSRFNAYLMYLDIGANGDGEEGSTDAPVASPYNISMVDFVSSAQGTSQSGGEFSVPTDNNGSAYFPHYQDVTFQVDKLSGGSDLAKIAYKRAQYDPNLLPTSENNQITAKVLYNFVNMAVTPVSTGNLAERDETLALP